MQENSNSTKTLQDSISATLPVGQGDLMDRESKSTGDPFPAQRGPSKGRPSTPIYVFSLDDDLYRTWSYRRVANQHPKPGILTEGQVFPSVSALAAYLGISRVNGLHSRLALSLKSPNRVSRLVAGAQFKYKLSE